MTRPAAFAGAMLSTLILSGGCTPSVKVEAPDKPIEITMNVKIEHEIRLRIEKDVEELITTKKGLF
ncbi:YnbE family lipoprotein [Methylococcus sp. EFPC2]|uniref:YnbE family lipoprotein n=1 Tax=Methylococcus sp. EFPC2 TaxID=2812648 RepID=UPI00196813C2|nr:YnbE family lipoprotein [Methylococcus sp. EFPC2]QSA97211.1 YnbE family lipoprotein [Methylococcus sp. EFPC2]